MLKLLGLILILCFMGFFGILGAFMLAARCDKRIEKYMEQRPEKLRQKGW